MLLVEAAARIRRAFFRKGKSIKATCRDLGVSRKVVRRVIRSGATAVPVANCDDRAARVCRLSGGTIELRE